MNGEEYNLNYWLWEGIGFAGQLLFFGRLLVQWAASERERKPVIPLSYWYMSIFAAAIVFAYAIHKESPSLLMAEFVGGILYIRNLFLELKYRKHNEQRIANGFESGDYPWPKLSVIVPVHNESKVLANTLENLLKQRYPGPKPEIIVALNGCIDASWAIAQGFDVKVVESPNSGMSFGKNLGASAATGDILIFIDADTTIPDNALRLCSEALHDTSKAIATVPGQPDRGGPVVKLSFIIANRTTRKHRVHAPGGVMVMHRKVYEEIKGFDEKLPQGTSTDLILRAREAGAEYIFINSFTATTSIRRFEKTGVVQQMLQWRKNHEELENGQREKVTQKEYENVR